MEEFRQKCIVVLKSKGRAKNNKIQAFFPCQLPVLDISAQASTDSCVIVPGTQISQLCQPCVLAQGCATPALELLALIHPAWSTSRENQHLFALSTADIHSGFILLDKQTVIWGFLRNIFHYYYICLFTKNPKT